MTNPIIKIHNSQTGQEIERPMTDEEFTAWETANAESKYQ